MSGYSYKGINVNNICVNNGTTANVSGFSGMPATSATNYSSMCPLTFGYTTGNPPVDLCNQYAASNTGIITTSGNHTIPIGAKSCRVISVGGGGGSGGKGGNAAAESFNGNGVANGNGGAGGTGGYGTYNYSNVSLSGYTGIYTFIGGAGTNGNAGSNQKVNSNYTPVPAGYNNNKTNNVNAGNDGNAGIQTYIQLTTTNSQSGYYAIGNAGNGGIGGGPASANASQNKANANDGNAGAAGTPTTIQANDINYPTLSNYGNPSTQGAVQIIWLYD
jgi:hypothetical protein